MQWELEKITNFIPGRWYFYQHKLASDIQGCMVLHDLKNLAKDYKWAGPLPVPDGYRACELKYTDRLEDQIQNGLAEKGIGHGTLSSTYFKDGFEYALKLMKVEKEKEQLSSLPSTSQQS